MEGDAPPPLHLFASTRAGSHWPVVAFSGSCSWGHVHAAAGRACSRSLTLCAFTTESCFVLLGACLRRSSAAGRQWLMKNKRIKETEKKKRKKKKRKEEGAGLAGLAPVH